MKTLEVYKNARAILHQDIAKHLGVTPSYITMLITGKRHNPVLLQKIDNYLSEKLNITAA